MDDLLRSIATLAAEVAREIEPPRLRPMLTYDEAGDLLGVSGDGIRRLVASGQLDRPDWARRELPRAALVTTVSVFRLAGWPVTPLEVAVPAAA